MPSTITHEYHYRDVYKKTSKAFKNNYSEELYRSYSAGSQGHDAYFFLDFWNLPEFKKKSAKAELLQDDKFQDLCIELSRLIIEETDGTNKEIRLILYGYILHHILDSHVHPYIIYETQKSNLHAQAESYLDEWMIGSREEKKANYYPIHKLIPKMPRLKSETKDILSRAFKKIYKLENFGEDYERGLRQVPIFLRLFRYDPTGIKKFGYHLVDLTHLSKTKYYWLSYHNRFTNYEYYLNGEKRTWYNPVDAKTPKNESFKELYNQAVEEGAHIISKLEEALNSKTSTQELKKIIPRISANPIKKEGKRLTNIEVR